MTLRALGLPRGRRAASSLLIVVGASLLLVAGASIARGAIARDAVRSRWHELEASRAATDARASVSATVASTAARGAPIARLVIARLGLDEVVVEGVGDEELRAGPGHMTGTALPGDRGNAVISAHRDRHFHSLGRVSVGDTIVTETARGRAAWSVVRIRIVSADAPALHTSATPMLTLTTCWPIRFFGPAPDRLIVEATPID
jgi:sortase A